MDHILIRDMSVGVRVGVYAHEQRDPQQMILDLRIGIPGERVFISDSLDDTIDYAEVVASIRQLAVSRHFRLVEYFAGCVASLLIGEFGAPWVEVRAAKVGVVGGVAFSGVVIHRTRQDAAIREVA